MEQERLRALLAELRNPQRTYEGWRQAGDTPEYPPATEEQLRETETQLGIPLHPALRALYAEVANGGNIFRNGCLVFGVVGGMPPLHSPALVESISHSGWRLNARVDAALRRFPGVFVECEERPEGFVSVADLGCAITLEWDSVTGRLYATSGGSGLMAYRASLGLPIEPGMEDRPTYTVEFFLPSVEEWIEREVTSAWPTGEHYSGPLTQEMLREVDALGEAEPDGK